MLSSPAMFQSSPGPEAERTGGPPQLFFKRRFQSSPGPEAERDGPHGPLPEVDEQGFNPRPARRPSATSMLVAFISPMICFNPRPARRPSATVGPQNPGKTGVSGAEIANLGRLSARWPLAVWPGIAQRLFCQGVTSIAKPPGVGRVLGVRGGTRQTIRGPSKSTVAFCP